jgi:hypothetical protein
VPDHICFQFTPIFVIVRNYFRSDCKYLSINFLFLDEYTVHSTCVRRVSECHVIAKVLGMRNHILIAV